MANFSMASFKAWQVLLVIFKYLSLSEYECESRLVGSDYLQPHALYSSWNSPGQNTGVGSLSLLQG